jgi:hypothetical protein
LDTPLASLFPGANELPLSIPVGIEIIVKVAPDSERR